MGYFEITTGDFLKNAGIVGMKYLLNLSDGKEQVHYGISENGQALWLDSDFALRADWTELYFKAFVQYLGPVTAYQSIIEKIQICMDKIQNDAWKAGKEEKEDLNFINEKLLSNSYKSGFENIKEKIENPEVYENLKKNKLKEKMDVQELWNRLSELQNFLKQPLCAEIFSMKSIIYNYINRFWDGKCFLLRANAQKDMKEVFEQEFSGPMKAYWQSEHKKAKELCIDCGSCIESKERVSIAFMKEMADDLTRKRSAFWNCKVDAFLCPVCAFVYALSPLGFQLIGNKFVFVNTNQSVEALFYNNTKLDKAGVETQRGENEKYPSWFARIMNTILYKKTQELSNVQIILRGIRAEDQYMLRIIHKGVLRLLNNPKIQERLVLLEKHPIVKNRNDFWNVYEECVLNIVEYHNQYTILNRLLKISIESEGIASVTAVSMAGYVFYIQLCMGMMGRKEMEEGRKIVMNRFSMRDSGYALRKALLESKGTNNDECLRGTIYQLLNALSVRNEEKFIEIALRIYCSSKLMMPDGFVQMLGNQEKFMEYGYAFVLGLKGSHWQNKEEERENV